MINTLTTEVWVHLSWFRFPSTIQLVQNQLITKQATFNDVNKTNWLKPITSTPTVFYFRQLSSSANITSLLGNINWTQIQQYMTKEAEFLSQTNRSESKKNRKKGEGRSIWNPISDCRWPLKMCSSSSIASLSVSALSPTLLFSLLSSKTRWVRFVFFKTRRVRFSSKTRWVRFSSKTGWVRLSSKTRRVRFS